MNKETTMADDKNLLSLSASKAKLTIEGPNNNNVIQETGDMHCRWMCNIPAEIKAVVNKIVSYMQNPEVNGSISILDNFIFYDAKNCSKIDGLKTVVTNFACLVPFNLNKDYCGWGFEVHEMEQVSYVEDKLFTIKVTGHGQIQKLLSKCILPAKERDSDCEVNILASRRMETSVLKSVLHKSINKIQQEGTLKTAAGCLVLLNIKDRSSYLILDIGLVEGENSQRKENYEVSLIPSVKVTSCQHLLPCHKPKIKHSSIKVPQSPKEKGSTVLEIPKIPGAVNTQLRERMWTLACVEQHSTCPEPNVFSTKYALDEIACATNATSVLTASSTGRSLSAKEAEHCEKIISPASRLLLEYYYHFGHIPEDEMQAACDFVMKIIQNLEKSIKADLKEGDPVVKKFFRSGSTAEGLKVCSPNEFDIMIPVEISQTDPGSYSVICEPDFPLGYAICKINSTEPFSPKLRKCVIENRLFGQVLSPQKLAFSWFLGLVQRAINKQKSENPSVRLKVRRKGPALMLEIQSNVPGIPGNIDVDLVLAIETTNEKVPRLVVAKASSLEAYYKTKLQEKGLETKERVHLKDEDLKCFWRISYSVQEKRYLEIIKEQQIAQRSTEGCQIICLKILKTVREREVLKKSDSVMGQKLNTYLLKTCLYHVLATKSSPENWSYERLAERYLDVFNFFLSCLVGDMLPHFFYESKYDLEKIFPRMIWNTSENRVNLLNELHSTLRDQIYTRMKQICDSFKEMKQRIEKITKECFNCCEVAKTSQRAKSLKSSEFHLNGRSFSSANEEDDVAKKQLLQGKTMPVSSYTLVEYELGSTHTYTAIDKKKEADCQELTPHRDGLSVFKLTENPNATGRKDLISRKRPAPSDWSEHDVNSLPVSLNIDAIDCATQCERTAYVFELVSRELFKTCSLEQFVHPDFVAMPWCKRPSAEDSRSAEIARKMAKETRKNGANDFEKLKTKCTVEVEKVHQRKDSGDEESDDIEYYYDSDTMCNDYDRDIFW